MLQIRVRFVQNADGMLPSSWILLDNCSTSSVCNNESMIENICYCNLDETLTAYTNGGSNKFTHIAPFNFLPMEKHFNPDSTANISVIKYVA